MRAMKILAGFFFAALVLFNATGGSAAGQDALIVAVGKDEYLTTEATTSLGKYPLNANIFESLTTFDSRYQLLPCLATDWQQKRDNTWQFRLRREVKFHDDSPLDAKAVKTALDRYTLGGDLLSGCKIEVAADDLVEISTPQANNILPYILSHPFLSIAKEGKTPIGTGPLQFVSYQRDQFLRVKRYEKYWGEKSSVSEIIFRFMPDSASRVMAFQAGEIDILAEVPWESLPMLQNQDKFRIHAPLPGTYVGIMVANHGALADPNVCKAISLSLKRSVLLKALWGGFGQPGHTILPPALLGPFAGTIPELPYDPQQAKTLLRGQKPKITLVSGFPNAQLHGELPEILQSQLNQIGIELNIVKVNDLGLYHTMMRDRQGDLWLERGSINSLDLTFIPYLLFHPNGYYPTKLHTASGGDRFSDLLAHARAAKSFEDLQRRTALAINEIVHQQHLFIPLAILPQLLVSKNTIIIPEPYPTKLAMRWHRIKISTP